MEISPPEDLDLAQQAIDDAIEVLHGRDPAPPGRYLIALAMWCSTLIAATGSRDEAIAELREVAAACQLDRLQLAEQT
jgi:hypothetical protein